MNWEVFWKIVLVLVWFGCIHVRAHTYVQVNTIGGQDIGAYRARVTDALEPPCVSS